jgi:hypothetical protein
MEGENVPCVRKKSKLFTHTHTSEMFRNAEVGSIWLTMNEEATRKAIALCNKTIG